MIEYYLLRDARTNKFFGGGQADKLFSYWIEQPTKAKKFFRPDLMIASLQQMAARAVMNKPTEENEKILESIPLFDPKAYFIHRYQVDEETQAITETNESLMSTLERNKEKWF